MLFNSIEFPIFFIVVIIIYYQLRCSGQNIFLLISSYFFYGWWDWRFCSLLIFSSVLDYMISHKISRSSDNFHRKNLLLLSIIGNLGVLGFFKYFNFFVGSSSLLLVKLGFHPDFATLNILLPVGISFYTFQTLAYTVDVYRKKLEPADDFITFALYVSFFPQLVAGPIERASRLLPQFSKTRRFSYAQIRLGIPLILFGFFKKIVIADSMAPLVEFCFSNPSTVSRTDLLFGIYAFAIQIYCDFSGYSDIARGVARLLRIELMNNFSAPYFSRSITEFWRRWHISLSSWLRDYLYISLGGNRKNRIRTYLNLMLTMILGGLWHGASWAFVIWGGLHGLYLAAHKLVLNEKKMQPHAWGQTGRLGVFNDILKMVLTFHLVCFSWLFFRTPTFDIAGQYLIGMIHNSGNLTLCKPVLMAGVALVLIDIGHRISDDYGWFLRLPRYWRYAFAGCLVAGSVLSFGYHYRGPTPFIYFQF